MNCTTPKPAASHGLWRRPTKKRTPVPGRARHNKETTQHIYESTHRQHVREHRRGCHCRQPADGGTEEQRRQSQNAGARQAHGTNHRGHPAAVAYAESQIRVGARLHLESQPLQAAQPFPSRLSQHRHRHHDAAGIQGGGRHPLALGEPGLPLAEGHSPHHRQRETHSVDHARPMAFYRHLPLQRRVHQIQDGMPPLPAAAPRRKRERLVSQGLPPQAANVAGRTHRVRGLQPLAGGAGAGKRPPHGTRNHVHPQHAQHQHLPTGRADKGPADVRSRPPTRARASNT